MEKNCCIGLLILVFTSFLPGMANGQFTVNSTSPSANAMDVSRNSDLVITFSDDVYSSTVSASTIKIRSDQRGQIAGTFSTSGTEVTFTPDNNFRSGEQIEVTVTTGVTNYSGTALANPHAFAFTTSVSSAPESPPQFADSSVTTSADGAMSVTAADLDGDGDLDLASASIFDDKIAWYENTGGGSFGSQQVVTTSANGATSVTAADLDGDGDLDLASDSFSDNEIIWYENTGGGSFGTQQVVTTNANEATSVTAADLDGDGDMDLASASGNDDKIAWYENSGGGSFGTQQVVSTNADGASSVAAADLDGDGDLDLASASRNDNKIAWYENTGGGSFGSQQTVTTAAEDAKSVTAADLDGDGDLDLASASFNDNKIAWYENTGGGSFGTQQVVSTSANYAQSVTAADLDGDGDLDLVSAAQQYDEIAWYENDGTGSFGSEDNISSFAQGPRSIVAADLDGDGDLDLASASRNDDKIAWFNNNDPYPPDITNFVLGSDGSGNLDMSFDSNESLDSIKVTVDGPNTTDVYTFSQADFYQSSGSYILEVIQSYSDGVGTYTATVDDAFDSAGNNGGHNGSGSVFDSYNYDGTGPKLITAEVVSGKTVLLAAFDKDVFTNSDGTGSLTSDDFAYIDNSSSDAGAVINVDHTAGDSTALLTLDSAVKAADLGTDELSPANGEIYDMDGSEAGGTSTVKDTEPPADPVSTIGATITATNASNYSVDVLLVDDHEAGQLNVTLSDGSDTGPLKQKDITAELDSDSDPDTITVSDINASNLAEGTITISASFSDYADNLNPSGLTASSTTTKETIIPTISSVSLDSDGSDNLDLRFDSDESLDSIAVSVDGPNTADVYTFRQADFSKTDNGDGTITYALSTTQAYGDGDGTYTAAVDDALDSAGNNGGNNGSGSNLTDSYNFDSTAPTVSISDPNDGDLVTSQSSISGSSSDNVQVAAVDLTITNGVGDTWDGSGFTSTATTVTAAADDGSFDSDTEAWTYGSPPSANGDYTVKATATDGADNRATSAAVSYTIDGTIPSSLNLDSPTSTQFRPSGGSLDVSYSYSEDHPDTTTITFADGAGNNATYGVDDSGYAADGSAKTVTLSLDSPDQTDGSGFVDGTTYDITVEATDSAGNSASDTGTDLLTIDDTAPAISSVSLDNDGAGNLAFSFDADEQLGASASDLAVSVDGPNTADVYTFGQGDFSETDHGDGSFTYTLSTTQAYGDGDGTYTAAVDDALDSAGNNGGNNGAGSDLTDTYELDTTGPTMAPSLTTMAVAGGDIELDWGDVDEGTATYSVRRSTTSGSGYSEITTISDDDRSGEYTYTDPASVLSEGTTYYYVVVPVDGSGNKGATSNEDSAISDGTPPTINNLVLDSDGSGNLAFSFDADEQLGASASDLAVSVDGPNTADVYTFGQGDFSETDHGDGSFTYTLSTTQAYGDGDGTYTAAVDDALDSAGNNGGNNGSGSTLTDSYKLAPPAASSLTPADGATGVAVDATVSITFDQDVSKVDLSRITMEDTSGNALANVNASLNNRSLSIEHDDFANGETYTVIIPAGVVTNADGVGNKKETWSFTTLPAQVTTAANVSFGDASSPKDYRLVALPGAAGKELSNVLSGEPGVDWQAWWDDGSSQDYLIKYDGSDRFTFEAGKGFWITSTDSFKYTQTLPMIEPNDDGELTIPLQSGWNIISNPLDIDVDWSAVTAANGGGLQPIWGFDGSFSQASVFASATMGKAYYFLNNQDLQELIIPYKETSAKTQSVNKQKRHLLRLLTLVGTDTTAVSQLVLTEQHPDQANVVAPPGNFELASLRFLANQNPDRRSHLTRIYQQQQATGHSYQLVLSASPDTSVTIGVEGWERSLSSKLALINQQTGRTYHLKERSELTITPDRKRSKWALAMGDGTFIDRQQRKYLPKQLKVFPNYPNPFNPKTTLKFNLPEEQQVQVRIYNILGRKVATLVNEVRQAGVHRLTFDGSRQASGVYFAVFDIGDRRRVQKLMLIK